MLSLDESGELPAPVQVKILRFQEKRFLRVRSRSRQEIAGDACVLATRS